MVNDLAGNRPSHQDLGYWVASVASALIRDFSRRFSRYGITPVQFRILEMCFRGEVNTVTGLARVIVLDPGGISRQAEQLRQKGLLRRRRQAQDRRTVLLELTPKGRNLVPELIEHMEASHGVCLDGFSEEERGTLFEMLNRILDNLSNQEIDDGPDDNLG